MEYKRKEVIAEFHEIECEDPKRARSLIKRLDYKEDHFLLKCIAMTFYDEAHFDKIGNWIEFPNKRKLKKSKKYISEAFRLNSKCSNVLWMLGKLRTAYREEGQAIDCYKKIIKIGPKRISQSCCKNELNIASAQVNDSKLQLYRLYKDMDSKKSKRYLREYKTGLKKGVSTLYIPLEKYL